MAEDKGGYRQINKSLNICVFEEYLKGQTTNLPKLANVEQVSSRVLRVLGQNPGKVSSIHILQFYTNTALTRLQSSLFRVRTRTSSAPASKDCSSTLPAASQNGLR